MNNVWLNFDWIVCINLPNRTDRRQQVQKEFDKVGAHVSFVNGTPHQVGQIGLMTTLLEIFTSAEGTGYGTRDHIRNILVFEDDVFFVGEDPVGTLERAWGDIEFYYPNFDLLYLGANLTRPAYQVTPNLALIDGALAAHAVVYSDRVFQDYIDHLRRVVEQGEIRREDDISDVFLTRIQDRGRSFVVTPRIATQRPSWSDIEKRYTDYTSIIR